MARAPVLSSSTLSPFGGGGGGFGAFSIVNPGREAYLIFTKAENAWQNGELSNADYLAALKVYADAQTPGTAEASNVAQKLEETTYRVNRNVIVAEINAGTSDPTKLLEYDRQALTGLNQDSQTYQDRLSAYEATQQRVFSDAEQAVVDHYQAGTITTAQLQQWYRDQVPTYAANHDLTDSINKQIANLDQRVVDERDSQVVADYNDGRMGDAAFIAYATAARARYATGTSQAIDWDKRLEAANTAQAEDGLLYRYGLSQQYAQLQQFVDSNAGKPAGGTSTSTSTRTILGADGQWHTVTSTSSKATAPTAAEQAAYRDLQLQIADAKSQMAAIAGQLAAAPDTQGFVSTDQVIAYYSSRITGLVKGSADWYAMQGKIDSLVDRQHQEAVLAQQGLKISYPTTTSGVSGGTATRTSSGGGSAGVAASSSTTLDAFMAAIAKQESGGRYDARNATSGAFGKYQILPSNWSAWATAAGLSSSAPQTPENQETVARAKMQALYTWLGSWDAVAYWWNNGGTKETATNPANWSKSGKSYVDAVMGQLGQAATPSPTTSPVRGVVGGLSTIVSVGRPFTKTGAENVSIAGASFPVNLDSAAFTKFYSAYVSAFNSGAESFVDTSSGKPVAYFIGSDVNDRIDRMRQLDDLRVGLFTEKAAAYAGTASEITAAGQLNSAYQDAAAHEYRILDTLTQTRAGAKGSLEAGPQGPADQIANPLAAGIRGLDKLEAGITAEVKAAQEAYSRGDISAAYAHLQLARSLTSTDVMTSGPNKGTQMGAVVNIGKYATASQALVAAVQQAYGGVGITEALGSAGAKVQADLDRLTNFGNEIDGLFAKGSDMDKLATTVQQQIKTDSHGNAVYDSHGQVTLADGFVRFADANGNVTIERPKTAGIDPNTGQPASSMPGYTKALVKVGSTVEDVYTKWTLDTVGYIKNPGGKNIPLQGKVARMTIDGQVKTFYEDPLHPGVWADHAVIYNAPTGLSTTLNSDGSVTPTFTIQGSPKGGNVGQLNGATLTLQLDQKTGTYLIVANKTGGLFSPEIKNLAVGGAGDQNVLDLLNAAGFTRDSSNNGPGFNSVGVPVFGMTSDQLQTYLHPAPVGTAGGGSFGAPVSVPTRNVAAEDARLAPRDLLGPVTSQAPPATVPTRNVVVEDARLAPRDNLGPVTLQPPAPLPAVPVRNVAAEDARLALREPLGPVTPQPAPAAAAQPTTPPPTVPKATTAIPKLPAITPLVKAKTRQGPIAS